MKDGRTLRAHLSLLPKGHNARKLLDDEPEIDDWFSDFIKEFNYLATHRRRGVEGPEPLLATLDLYDRKMRIDREPYEVDILITLDLLERAHRLEKK